MKIIRVIMINQTLKSKGRTGNVTLANNRMTVYVQFETPASDVLKERVLYKALSDGGVIDIHTGRKFDRIGELKGAEMAKRFLDSFDYKSIASPIRAISVGSLCTVMETKIIYTCVQVAQITSLVDLHTMAIKMIDECEDPFIGLDTPPIFGDKSIKSREIRS